MKENLTKQIYLTASKFGIKALKPYQILVINRIMEQEDLDAVRNQIVVLPTGTGKSACFLIPAMLCNGITVIVYPLLALINDQCLKLDACKADYICIKGGLTNQERHNLFKKLDNGTRIVITTPESLKRSDTLAVLKRKPISLFVVDEAHVISQWGKSFRPAYIDLRNAIIQLRPHQTLAFTATASEQTIKDITHCLFFSKPLIVRGDADRPNIIYSRYLSLDRKHAVYDLVMANKKPAIVFCQKRNSTFDISFYLKLQNPKLDVRYYHAGLSSDERKEIETWFMKSKDGILVSTSAYGMGVDKKDIRTIIHTRLPQSAEEYLQESGRAGRDEKTSKAWVIVTVADLYQQDYSPLLSVFKGNECRRSALLKFMNQDKNECTGCDVCLKKTTNTAFGEYQIKALIKSAPFRFNPGKASYLLCSSQSLNKNLRFRYSPLYSTLKDYNPRAIRKTIQTLASDKVDYPIKSISVKNYGDLLYPSDNKLCCFIAFVIKSVFKL